MARPVESGPARGYNDTARRGKTGHWEVTGAQQEVTGGQRGTPRGLEEDMQQRTRCLALALAAALVLTLAACGGGAGSAYTGGAEELARAAVISQGYDPAALERLDQVLDEAALAGYVQGSYGLAPDQWESGVIFRTGGAEAFEIAALALADEADNDDIQTALEGYIRAREGDFLGYAPEQAAMIAGAQAQVRDGFALLFICPAPALAWDTVLALLAGDTAPTALPAVTAAPESTPEPTLEPAPSPAATAQPAERPPYEPPNTDDMTQYDTAPILAAWEARDPSGLGEHDRAIYDAAEAGLDRVVTEGMSDDEKELALYGWVTWNLVYDWAHQDPLAEVSRDSYGPYGGLVAHRAVCLGVASSFQLLMDMAGVECITVLGSSSNLEDHAWNMVRLAGEWYCVDPTWDLVGSASAVPDDESGWGPALWDYFNVTSDEMVRTGHRWDYDAVPEATDTTYAR